MRKFVELNVEQSGRHGERRARIAHCLDRASYAIASLNHIPERPALKLPIKADSTRSLLVAINAQFGINNQLESGLYARYPENANGAKRFFAQKRGKVAQYVEPGTLNSVALDAEEKETITGSRPSKGNASAVANDLPTSRTWSKKSAHLVMRGGVKRHWLESRCVSFIPKYAQNATPSACRVSSQKRIMSAVHASSRDRVSNAGSGTQNCMATTRCSTVLPTVRMLSRRLHEKPGKKYTGENTAPTTHKERSSMALSGSGLSSIKYLSVITGRVRYAEGKRLRVCAARISTMHQRLTTEFHCQKVVHTPTAILSVHVENAT